MTSFYGKALQAKRIRELEDFARQEHPRDVDWESITQEIDLVNNTVLDMELYEDE